MICFLLFNFFVTECLEEKNEHKNTYQQSKKDVKYYSFGLLSLNKIAHKLVHLFAVF
jgi:hypothetical protein